MHEQGVVFVYGNANWSYFNWEHEVCFLVLYTATRHYINITFNWTYGMNNDIVLSTCDYTSRLRWIVRYSANSLKQQSAGRQSDILSFLDLPGDSFNLTLFLVNLTAIGLNKKSHGWRLQPLKIKFMQYFLRASKLEVVPLVDF